MTIKQLSIEDAEFIAHALALQTMNSNDEPIPAFHTRQSGKLESCLAEPFQTYDGKSLHRTFDQKAAVLFYLITKNHCFENGNKRMAVTITLAFFFTNKRWLSIDPLELYEISRHVAESKPKERSTVQSALVVLFKKYGEPLY